MSELTIIVTMQNTRDYLKKCLDSIAFQTFRDFEVFLVDDNSACKSEDIVHDYCSKFPISYYYLNEALGPGGARNIALNKASGKYICFCDSDDWIDLNYYEKAVSFMNEAKAEIGNCGLIRNYDIQPNQPIYKCKYEQLYEFSGDMAIKIMTKQYDCGVAIVPASANKIFLRRFLLNNKLCFAEKIFYEDWAFALKGFLKSNKVICIPGVYYHHYKRAGSIVQSFTLKHIDDFGSAFIDIKKHLIETGNYERYRLNYYKFMEQFYNLIIRQIFQFVPDEAEKKDYIRYSFSLLKELVVLDEYIEYVTAEKLRRHIQPHITDTTIF